MFAYCNNNPVNAVDAGGYLHRSLVNPNAMLDSGGYLYYGVPDSVRKAEEEARKARRGQNLFNTDAKAVIAAEGYAFYNGCLVIKQDWAIANKRSGSLGVIFLYTGEVDSSIVKHEYGHVLQLGIVGLPNYLLFTALPSYKSDPRDPYYYSNPWERVADCLGGVDRGAEYRKGSLAWGIAHMLFGAGATLAYYIIEGG